MTTVEMDEVETLRDEIKELLLTLPKETADRAEVPFYLYQGFWCRSPELIRSIIDFQKNFRAKASDVFVTSLPKCGTTWLKALTFAVLNRHRFGTETHPLLTSNSHKLVPFIEFYNRAPDFFVFDSLPEPRLLGAHLPYPSLGSVKESDSKIIYICRNPFDSFVSFWHFVNKTRQQSLLGPRSLEDAFDRYCRGINAFGPFWDHILGYWKESLKRPSKVLFLKYEEMHKDVVSNLKTMAAFMECPFTEEEERNGVIEDIAKLCSFDTMKKLEINQTGKFVPTIETRNLFRKAEVGDWVNYFTPEMEERMLKIIEEKFHDSGLIFEEIPKLIDHVKKN